MLLEVQPDVVIGGGHPCPSGTTACDYRYVPSSLYQAMSTTLTSDYHVVERRPGVDGGQAIRAGASEAIAKDRKLLGLFGGPAGNFAPPVPRDAPGGPAVSRGGIEDPLLRDATLAALEVLATDEDGFFLMVEQGDIDWANHVNDYAWMVGTTWDLHEAVAAAAAFVSRPDNRLTWDNTLVVVTADHATGYLRLTGQPVLGAGQLPVPDRVPCGGSGQPVCSYVGKGVSYGTTGHTNELVRLYARGAAASRFSEHEGSWYPGTRIIDNTQVHRTLAAAVGLPSAGPYRVRPERFDTRGLTSYSTRTGWGAHLAADVVGDAKADLVSFHPSNGTWWVTESLPGGGFATPRRLTTYSTRTGWEAHLAADVVGDAKADLVSYHPSNGTWWVTSAGSSGVFGSPTWLTRYRTPTGWEVHLAADVTGNGGTDLLSYRPTDGSWWVTTDLHRPLR
jgi:hypothetical protein